MLWSNFITAIVTAVMIFLSPSEGNVAVRHESTADAATRTEFRAPISRTVVTVESAEKYETAKLIRETAEIIKLHEGFSAKPYLCTSGQWTQGYGRKVEGPRRANVGPKQAHAWLIKDLNEIVDQLDAELPWWRNLSPVRQQVVMNLVYNLGSSGIYKFKNFLAATEKGEFTKAAREILYSGAKKTKYWKQVGDRAVHLAEAMRTGSWTDEQGNLIYT